MSDAEALIFYLGFLLLIGNTLLVAACAYCLAIIAGFIEDKTVEKIRQKSKKAFIVGGIAYVILLIYSFIIMLSAL